MYIYIHTPAFFKSEKQFNALVSDIRPGHSLSRILIPSLNLIDKSKTEARGRRKKKKNKKMTMMMRKRIKFTILLSAAAPLQTVENERMDKMIRG